jgi:hypothetical protein
LLVRATQALDTLQIVKGQWDRRKKVRDTKMRDTKMRGGSLYLKIKR